MKEARDPQASSVRPPVPREDWSAVAASVNERMAAWRIGQQELAQLSGVSVSTIRQIQHGSGRRFQNKTIMAVSHALGWPEGHLMSILLNQRTAPRPLMDLPARQTDSPTTEALARIEARLHEISERLEIIERGIQGSS